MAPFCDKSSDFRFEWLLCNKAELANSNLRELMLVVVMNKIEGFTIRDGWRHSTPLNHIGELASEKGRAQSPKYDRHASTERCLVARAALMKQAYLVSELVEGPYEF